MQTKNVGVDGTEMCVSWAVGLLCHSCHHTKPVDICGWFVIERGTSTQARHLSAARY